MNRREWSRGAGSDDVECSPSGCALSPWPRAMAPVAAKLL